MPDDFDEADMDTEAPGRDRELTIGPTVLALLVVGLCGLCAVCFIAGFSAGRRSSSEPLAGQQASTGGSSAAQVSSGQSKPAASESSFQPHANAQPASASESAGMMPPSVEASTVAPVSPSAAQPPPAVAQAALPTQAAAAQPLSAPPATAAGPAVQPALPQTTTWMVQIAAVSHQEDADVLVGALRKRGYAVSVHHDPLDNLMHVQVGPFTTHSDAAAMRQRLLNDGYNAIVEP
jgi:cell division septation protein DedD